MATLPSNPPGPRNGPRPMPAVSLISDRCPACRSYGEHLVHRFPSGLTVQVCEQGDCSGARCWTPAGILAALAAGGAR